jgi:hypothetical protein
VEREGTEIKENWAVSKLYQHGENVFLGNALICFQEIPENVYLGNVLVCLAEMQLSFGTVSYNVISLQVNVHVLIYEQISK